MHHLSKRGIVAHQIKPLRCSFTPLDVFCVSTRDVSTSHSVSWFGIARSSRRSILLEFLPPLVVMLVGVPGARHQVSDGGRINVLMKCTLDREDCVGLVPPLSSYLTTWISGRDSCLVGVSCHSPRSLFVISCIFIHVIMFKFQLNLKWGCLNPSTKWIQLGSK